MPWPPKSVKKNILRISTKPIFRHRTSFRIAYIPPQNRIAQCLENENLISLDNLKNSGKLQEKKLYFPDGELDRARCCLGDIIHIY